MLNYRFHPWFLSAMFAMCALAGAATVSAQTPLAAPGSQPCHLLTSADTIPNGFGAAYNVFSAAKEPLLNVICGSSSNAVLTVGNGQSTTYIYRFGYEWVNGGWNQIALGGSELVANDWYVGTAEANLFRSQAQLAEDNLVVAYTCHWINNAWKCGCRDQSCSQNYWQLQAFRKAASSGGGATAELGKAVPIAPGAHPNLYYNRQEVEQLRNMIKSGNAPSELMWAWNSSKNATAQNVPSSVPSTYPEGERTLRPIRHNNMLASISYMIEPTQSKANRMKDAVMSFVNKWPNGKGTGFVEGMYGYHVAWMFDLVMGFHPNTFSSAEVQKFKTWAAKSVMMGQTVSKNSRSNLLNDSLFTGSSYHYTVDGKTVTFYTNWWSRSTGPHMALALVSGNQDVVTYWADSAWPNHVLSKNQITATSPPDDNQKYNRYDLAMYTLAIYPDGSNSDTHGRCQDGGKYHMAQGIGVQMAAEFAFRNGMTGIYNLKDNHADEAHLLLHGLYMARNFGKKHYSCNHNHEAHDSDYIYLTWARYDHPEINAAIGRARSFEEIEFPAEFITFYRYPRRVVWP